MKLLAISRCEIPWFKQKGSQWRSGRSPVYSSLPSSQFCLLIQISPICTASLLIFTYYFSLFCSISLCFYSIPFKETTSFVAPLALSLFLLGNVVLFFDQGLPTFPFLKATGAISLGYPLPCTFPRCGTAG